MTVWQLDQFVLNGKILSSNGDFILFESHGGRVLRLSGLARSVCEDTLANDLNLKIAMERAALHEDHKETVTDYFLKTGIFGPPTLSSPLKQFLSRFAKGRIELTLLKPEWVGRICKTLHTWKRETLFSLIILSLCSLLYWIYKGVELKFAATHAPLPLFISFFLSAMVHEVGHAYALYYYNEKPGVIGLKVFGPFLAAFTDVNRAWMLHPRQRAVVSAGGLILQGLAVPIFTVLLSLSLGQREANIFMTVTLITMFFMALPMRENDGDWFLKDIIASLSESWLRTSLVWVRRIFAILGMLFFAKFLMNGWVFLVREFKVASLRLDAASLWTVFMIGMIALGTWSFVTMTKKMCIEILEFLKDCIKKEKEQ